MLTYTGGAMMSRGGLAPYFHGYGYGRPEENEYLSSTLAEREARRILGATEQGSSVETLEASPFRATYTAIAIEALAAFVAE